jgi:hypothetical protein
MKKESNPDMVLWTCEEWKAKKCKSPQPCQAVFPAGSIKQKELKTCPIGKNGIWLPVPTMRLTI